MTVPILFVSLEEGMCMILKCNTVVVLPGMAYQYYTAVKICQDRYMLIQLTKHILKMTTCSENI